MNIIDAKINNIIKIPKHETLYENQSIKINIVWCGVRSKHAIIIDCWLCKTTVNVFVIR